MNKVKELRIAMGITQDKLAEVSGLSRSMLYYLETGKRPMRVQHAEVLAPIFGVTVDYIMGTDAIYFAGAFKDALRNLLDEMFDEIVEASFNNSIDEYTKLLYSIIRKIFDSGMGSDELKIINDLINNIIDNRKPEVK